jgi:hypothetical protein
MKVYAGLNLKSALWFDNPITASDLGCGTGRVFIDAVYSRALKERVKGAILGYSANCGLRSKRDTGSQRLQDP